MRASGGLAAQRNRHENAQVDAAHDHEEPKGRDRKDVDLEAIQQLTADDTGGEDADRRQERPRVRLPERGDEGDERGRDDDEVEQHEREQVRPPARSRKFVGDRPERSTFFADGEHHRAVVLQPADEEVPANDPQEGGDPTERDPDERAQNGPERRDALELVTPQHVPTHGKVLDTVHVHVGRRGLLRVGAPDVPVNPLPVSPVRDRIQSDSHDDPQKRS